MINLNRSSRNLLVGNVHFSREKTSGLPYLAGGQNLTNALINTNRSAISNMSYQGQLIFAHGKLILCHRHLFLASITLDLKYLFDISLFVNLVS